MRLLPIEKLIVATNRQRREFSPKNLMELQESIEYLGLMQPLVVRDGNHLVAGERRKRAIEGIWALGGTFYCHNQPIPEGMLPVIDLGDLDPLQAMEAELDENIRRQDLTWQEHAVALARLNELRTALNPAHTVTDLALELEGRSDGDYREKTRQALIVAQHLDNPNVAKAADVKEAFKILRRADEAERATALGLSVGRTFTAAEHTLLFGDCLDWMFRLPAESFDCILTDPPYGIGADSFGDAAGRLVAITHEYSDDETSFKELLTAAALGIDRIAKPAAHLYLCCDIDQFHWLKRLFADVGGWKVFRTPLVNYKRGSGRVPLPEHGPRRQYELILYAHRGDKRTLAIYPDVVDTGGDENLGHGAQKPVELFINLLRRSCRPGDRVCDPFAGTGTVFPAAHELKVIATGIEKEPAYYGIGVKRLEALK